MTTVIPAAIPTPRPTPRAEYLPFAVPAIGEEEVAEVIDTLRSGWISTGPKTHRFESEFAAYLGAPGALALNSCTAAMHTALVTAGIGQGDEVITSTMTFAATANVIEHVRARPVLVDVEPDTLNLDPHDVAAAVTPRTRAIIAVHYAGHPAEMAGIQAVADEHHLLVIEDAAHALPAAYRGRLIGAGPNPTAFSFYATKNLTTGEGGMLTWSPAMLERARVFALHGMSADAWKRYARGGSWRYDVITPGFKYNMTDIQASLGLRQLEKLARLQARRAAIAAEYTRAFSDNHALEVPVHRSHVEHAWHLYVLRLRLRALRIGRDQLIDELLQRNIATSVHFIPLHLHPFYRTRYGLSPSRYPVAVESYERMLSLPLHPLLSDRDVSDVIEAVLDVVQAHRR